MRERLIGAASRNALIAAGFSAAMIYRWDRQGWPRRQAALLVYLFVSLGLTVVVATFCQVRGRVDRWSWTSTFGAFFLSFVGVSIAMVVAIRIAFSFR